MHVSCIFLMRLCDAFSRIAAPINYGREIIAVWCVRAAACTLGLPACASPWHPAAGDIKCRMSGSMELGGPLEGKSAEQVGKSAYPAVHVNRDGLVG